MKPMPIYYQIKKSGQPTSYLFGTCHIPCQQLEHIKPWEFKSFRESQQVLCEQDKDKLRQVAEGLLIKNQLSEIEIKAFYNIVSKINWENIPRIFHEAAKILRNVSMDKFKDLPFPMVGSFILGNEIIKLDSDLSEKASKLNERMGLVVDNIMDVKIANSARAQDKEVFCLDTVEKHSEAVNATFAQQMAGYKKYIKLDAAARVNLLQGIVPLMKAPIISQMKLMEQLILAYGKQNSTDIKDFLDSFLKEKLVKDRNLVWINKINSQNLLNKSSFIAVGFFHLLGDNGLVSLLKKEGYTLTPMDVPLGTNKARVNDIHTPVAASSSNHQEGQEKGHLPVVVDSGNKAIIFVGPQKGQSNNKSDNKQAQAGPNTKQKSKCLA